jgi:hypothetical protein
MLDGESGVRGRTELPSEAGELPAEGGEGMAMGEVWAMGYKLERKKG